MKPDELMPQAPSHTGTRTQPPLQPQRYAKLAALGQLGYIQYDFWHGLSHLGAKKPEPEASGFQAQALGPGPSWHLGLGGLGSSQLAFQVPSWGHLCKPAKSLLTKPRFYEVCLALARTDMAKTGNHRSVYNAGS